MKTFLVLVFCLLVIDNGVSAQLPSVSLGDVKIDFNSGDSAVPLPPPVDWIVIMQRIDGSLSFYRTWKEYKSGFGELGGQHEFWLGNELIHLVTSAATYTLRIEVHTNGQWYYADYATFSLDSDGDKYAIHLSGYSGNAGDSLSSTTEQIDWNHNGMKFSTWDSDNDLSSANNCAMKYFAAWWFNNCWYSCLTCPYGDNFKWQSLGNLPSGGKLQGARMRIKRI